MKAVKASLVRAESDILRDHSVHWVANATRP
nr:hypothetical protein [Agrobacterium sp.]